MKPLIKKLYKPIDTSALAFFRMAFGLMMFVAVVRFFAKGWLWELYVEPTYFFKYYGFSWVTVWPEWGLILHFSLMGLLALFVAFGLYYRFSIIAFFLLFTYAELFDRSNYLNHYYFVSIMSALMIFMPLHRFHSFDALRKPQIKLSHVPQWILTTLRLQVGIVYFFAGVAKLKSDWLFEAQPLKIWLSAQPDFPILGPLFVYPETAYVMSWMGALFDLTVPFFLLYHRTRIFAYIAVIFFHFMTWKLFQIGMFPWIMMVMALVFFPDDWPKRFLKFLSKYKLIKKEYELNKSNKESLVRPAIFAKLGFFILLIHFVIQVFMPLRHWLYPGNVLWTEEGFNFSWNVMLMEKNGYVEYTVVDPDSGKRWMVKPSDYLMPHQVKAMSAQPEMILSLAHHISKDFEKKSYQNVKVYVDSTVSLNGRSNRVLIDDSIDLSSVKDSFIHKDWIELFDVNKAF